MSSQQSHITLIVDRTGSMETRSDQHQLPRYVRFPFDRFQSGR